MTKVEGKIYSCTVPADAPNIIFNNGTKQTDDLAVPSVSSGKNMYDYATGKWSTYTPAVPDQPSTEVCTHPAHTQDGLCSRCFAEVAHTFENSVCTVCGVSDEPPVTDPLPTNPTPIDPQPTEPDVQPTTPSASEPTITEPDETKDPSVTTPNQQTDADNANNDKEEPETSFLIVVLLAAAGVIVCVIAVVLIRKRKA
jgi:hypothetical protein